MQDPQLYINKSPFFKMDKVKAPVLIFHGSADTNVPPAQSWSYFRVLQYYGQVPVKFVVFPGEPHGPRKLTHQMRKVDEEVEWFDKYFFKTAKVEQRSGEGRVAAGSVAAREKRWARRARITARRLRWQGQERADSRSRVARQSRDWAIRSDARAVRRVGQELQIRARARKIIRRAALRSIRRRRMPRGCRKRRGRRGECRIRAKSPECTKRKTARIRSIIGPGIR